MGDLATFPFITCRLKKGMLRNPFAAVPLAYPQNLARLRPADCKKPVVRMA